MVSVMARIALKAPSGSLQFLAIPKPEPAVIPCAAPEVLGTIVKPTWNFALLAKVPYIQGPEIIMSTSPLVKAAWAASVLSDAFGAAAIPSFLTRSKYDCTWSASLGLVRSSLPLLTASPPSAIAHAFGRKNPEEIPNVLWLPVVSFFASDKNCSREEVVVGSFRPALLNASIL